MYSLHHAVSYDNASSLNSVKKVAGAADVAIVFASAHSGEGADRKNLLLQPVGAKDEGNFGDHSAGGGWELAMEDVIETVASTKTPVVVVLAVPGPIRTDWRTKVDAILCSFLPGEQYGNAIADLIFGKVAPQAKLPVTFPLTEDDQGMSVLQYPGVPSEAFEGHLHVEYSEKQINGYRWYDKYGVQPAFAFGHGLTCELITKMRHQLACGKSFWSKLV